MVDWGAPKGYKKYGPYWYKVDPTVDGPSKLSTNDITGGKQSVDWAQPGVRPSPSLTPSLGQAFSGILNRYANNLQVVHGFNRAQVQKLIPGESTTEKFVKEKQAQGASPYETYQQAWVKTAPDYGFNTPVGRVGLRGVGETLLDPSNLLGVGLVKTPAVKAAQEAAKFQANAAKQAAKKGAKVVGEAMQDVAASGKPTLKPSLGIKAGGKKSVGKVTKPVIKAPVAETFNNVESTQPSLSKVESNPLSPIGETPPVSVQPKAVPSGTVPPVEPPKPPITAGAMPEPKPEFAANIRLSKFQPEAQGVLKDITTKYADDIQAARRGVVSDAEVMEKAKALFEREGGDFSNYIKKKAKGEAWNVEETAALNGALQDNLIKLNKAKTALSSGSLTPESLMKMKMLEAERDLIAKEFTMASAGARAEAGRSLRWYTKQVETLAANPDAKMAKRIMNGVGGYDKLMEHADAFRALDLNDMQQVANFIRTVNKPSFMDKLTFVYYNSILSGPKTHIVNAFTNHANALGASAEHALAGIIDVPLSKISGRARQRFVGEAAPHAMGFMQGWKEGTKVGLQTLKTGYSPIGMREYSMNVAPIGGKLGRVVGVPTTLMEASDAMLYQAHYRAEMYADAFRQARSSGLKGKAAIEKSAEIAANPSEKMVSRIDEIAKQRLFRGDPPSIANSLMRMREQYPVLRFVLPFVKTPANILSYGLARSPAGIFNPKLYRNIIAKNPEAADQIARIILGSGVATGIAVFMAEGRITGAAPVNAAERDRFYSDGKQPYSFRVGDRWISYQRLEPLNQSFTQVASIMQAISDDDKTVP
ncbi:MAG: hypothetical protein WC657_06555, partial [Candidatus Paceibacterota bacterium]